MALSTARWEYQPRMRQEHSTARRESWLARPLQLAALPRPFKDRSLAETSTLKRLVNALGYMGR